MPSSKEETYGPVKRGDTLSKIAKEYKPNDVTLEQMLVLLYRNNKDAFAGNNMNRLKTGKVLSVPDPAEAADISVKEARKQVRMQVADFNAYRERIAGGAGEGAGGEESGQAATGRLSGPVTDKGAPASGEPKEVLKLSQGRSARRRQSRAGEDSRARRRIGRARQDDPRVQRAHREARENRQGHARLDGVEEQGHGRCRQAGDHAAGTVSDAAQAGHADGRRAPSSRHRCRRLPRRRHLRQPPGVNARLPPTAPPSRATPPTVTPIPPIGAPSTATPATPRPPVRPKPKAPPPPPPEPSLIDQALSEPLYLAGGIGLLAVAGFPRLPDRSEPASQRGRRLSGRKKNF